MNKLDVQVRKQKLKWALLTTLTAVAIIISFTLAWRVMATPKPTYIVIHPIATNGLPATAVQLVCPPGWKGNTRWNTYPGMDSNRQLSQYVEDAKHGVCRREKSLFDKKGNR